MEMRVKDDHGEVLEATFYAIELQKVIKRTTGTRKNRGVSQTQYDKSTTRWHVKGEQMNFWVSVDSIFYTIMCLTHVQ